MDRLTYRDEEGRAQWCQELLEDDSGVAGPLIRDRLAAYEDTKAKPEDFKKAFNEDALLKLTGQLLGVTPDRLRELVRADREGKLPKYTIGDTVYDRFGTTWEIRIAELHRLGGKPDWLYRCGHAGTDDYCALWESEIRAREEAEAAAAGKTEA